MTSLQINRIEGLLATATRGPWRADTNLGCKRISAKPYAAHQHAQAKRMEVACTPGLHDEAQDRANAELIAELRNEAAALLSAIREKDAALGRIAVNGETMAADPEQSATSRRWWKICAEDARAAFDNLHERDGRRA